MNTSDFITSVLSNNKIYKLHDFNLYQACMEMGLTPIEQHVYLCLLGTCDEEGIACMDEQSIANYSRISKRGAQTAIINLCEKNLLTKSSTGGHVMITKRVGNSVIKFREPNKYQVECIVRRALNTHSETNSTSDLPSTHNVELDSTTDLPTIPTGPAFNTGNTGNTINTCNKKDIAIGNDLDGIPSDTYMARYNDSALQDKLIKLIPYESHIMNANGLKVRNDLWLAEYIRINKMTGNELKTELYNIAKLAGKPI